MKPINNVLKNNFHIIINISLILSIYIGFYFNENITQGPKLDFEHALKQVEAFSQNFKFTFFNYDKIENSTRISPIFTSLLFISNVITGSVELTRFLLLNILLLNQLFFFKCLKISKIGKLFNYKHLVVISSLIYLSPSFRANIIWPESAMLGLLFFQISLFYFLKFNNSNYLKYAVCNIIFLAFASYIRPSFCIFSVYFFYKFFITFYNKNSFLFNLSVIISLNILLAFPAFYYVFILKIFFIEYGGLSNNYFNKISIIATLIFFHLIPVLYLLRNNLNFNLKKDLITLLLIFLSLLIIILNFDYDLNFSGGGIILHLSNFFFNNNYLFFIFYLIACYSIIKIIFLDKFNNFLIFLILIVITPQYHIFHKYYDPLVFIISLTILNLKISNKIQKGFNFILIIFSFYVSLDLVHLLNNYLN